MTIIPIREGAQLHLVVDNTTVRDKLAELYADSTADEAASVLTFFRKRLVEPHELTGMPNTAFNPFFDGPGAA